MKPTHYQEKVTDYFQSHSSLWNNVYTNQSVYAETMRARQALVRVWVDSLALPPGSQVLEIGCGAGFMSIALAESGLHVQAIDASEAMVQQARHNAAERGISDRLEVEGGDVYDLAFPDNTFDLVLAIGVFPWLAQTQRAVQEITRVTRPEAYVILTFANLLGLPEFLDPQLNPMLAPLRQRLKRLLGRVGMQVGLPDHLPKMVYHRRRSIDATLREAGLLKIQGKFVGFGPFSLFCRSILPNRIGLALHHRLQALADRNVPLVRSMGMAYLVLAMKPGLTH